MKSSLVIALSLVPTWASAINPTLQLEPVAIGQFFSPTTVTHAGDGSGRLFIADQRGKILILGDNGVLPTPFLDLGPVLVPERLNFDERGLLGLAFHPDFATADTPGHGRFYVYYSAVSPNAPGTAAVPVDHQSVLAEYRVSATDPMLADPSTERILLRFDQPQFNHNGGQLAFGPDGFLYLSSGDGGGAGDNNAGHTGGSSSQPSGVLGNSQDISKLLGKVLRIAPLGNDGPGGEYGIPTDNPFVDSPNGARKEIFAYGLRNPWRFSFDDGPGGSDDLFLADVGQGRVEEINIITSGGNYGWRRFEGDEDFDASTPSSGPYIDPIAAYAHPGEGGGTGLLEVGLSITGGYVYRGSAIPNLVGRYVFADWSNSFGSPNGTLLNLDSALSVVPAFLVGDNPIGRYIPCFGEDEEGELYLATRSALGPSAPESGSGDPSGQLFKIVDAPALITNTLVASKDNSIFNENSSNSNGAGSLFAGLTTGNVSGSQDIRRALIQFDLSGIPPDATIFSASLRLHVSKSRSGASDFTLHKISQDWGEGSSSKNGTGESADPGEATWSHAKLGTTQWTQAGGDFLSTISATSSMAGIGNYLWSSDNLTSDIQEWLDTPSDNHGWLLKADESTPSAKKIDSRDASNSANRPTLTTSYFPAPPSSHRQSWERQYFQIGAFIDPEADDDFDGIRTLIEYAWDLNPGNPDQIDDFLTIHIDPESRDLTGFFRRDPRATDLNYILEISENLRDWSPLVTSTLGAISSGPAFDFETPDLSNPETLLVNIAFTPPPASTNFVRLRVIRP